MGPANALSCKDEVDTSNDNQDVILLPPTLFIKAIDIALADKITLSSPSDPLVSAAERNYNIFDQELLAMIHALTEWKHYLQGTGHPITVVTDHKNLSYFKQPHKLSR